MAVLTTEAELRAIYGEPHARSVTKEIDRLNEQYQAFVKASPFVVLASSGADGIDCSPKGDEPGFVRIVDERTLALPDRPGCVHQAPPPADRFSNGLRFFRLR
jgi:predicted pyridoxine 5'-phosphate oxidase superfamily flavin-nucleotide-binding protein